MIAPLIAKTYLLICAAQVAAATSTSTTDSAGIAIITNPPSSATVLLSPSPIRSILISDAGDFGYAGATHGNEFLTGRGRIILRAGGSLLGVDRAGQWFVADTLGVITRIPSTMPSGRVAWMREFQPDSIVVWYFGSTSEAPKICYASSRAVLNTCHAVPAYGSAPNIGIRTLVLRDGSLLIPVVTQGTTNFRSDTAVSMSIDLVHLSRDGTVAQTVAQYTGASAFTYPLGASAGAVLVPQTRTAFAAELHLREFDDGFVSVSGTEWDIRVTSAAGAVQRSIRSNRPPRTATAVDTTQHFNGNPSLRVLNFRLAVAPSSIPGIGAIDVDEAGRIWARDYRIATGKWQWVAFSRDGVELGSLSIAAGGIMLGFAENRVAILETDAQGRESVVMYRFTMPNAR